MSISTKRYLIPLALLLFTAVLTFRAYPLKSYFGELYTNNIPIIVNNWYGRDLPMDERTYEILETRDAIMREYVNSDKETMLLAVVFSQNNRKISHPPEVCFSGGGWSIASKDKQFVTINSKEIEINRLILEKGSEKQVVLYLYKAGDILTSNYYAQQFNVILNGMLHKNTSSALIRISTNIAEDVDKTTVLTKQFAKEIIPLLEQSLP